jgi:hypothetical protein
MKHTGLSGIRSGLAGLAVLLTAASGFAAGLTTSGLLVRVGLAAAGFWTVGSAIELIWRLPPSQKKTSAVSSSTSRGRTLDIVLPAVKPEIEGPVADTAQVGTEP